MNEPARILIIDDEESIRKTLSMILRHAGYSVDTAANGKEAIEKTETNFYNLALIDVRLPDIEGTELLTSMKQTTPKMVKIMLTGYPGLQNAVKAINNGVDHYLIKPVDTNELLMVIREHLAIQSHEMENTEDKVAQFIETRLKRLESENASPR